MAAACSNGSSKFNSSATEWTRSLAHTGHARIRAIGVVAPLSPPYWLGEKPVVEMSLRTLRHLGDDSGDAPRVVSGVGSRVRHGFVVYRGGREASPTGETTR